MSGRFQIHLDIMPQTLTCHPSTRSTLPTTVHPGGYGERLSAVVALLSGAYRQSHQQVKACLAALLGIATSPKTSDRPQWLRCDWGDRSQITSAIDPCHYCLANIADARAAMPSPIVFCSQG